MDLGSETWYVAHFIVTVFSQIDAVALIDICAASLLGWLIFPLFSVIISGFLIWYQFGN